MVIEIRREDIETLIDGMNKLAEDYDSTDSKHGFIELQFIQSQDYLVILKLDKKGKIKNDGTQKLQDSR